jgi:hypothetical protein
VSNDGRSVDNCSPRPSFLFRDPVLVYFGMSFLKALFSGKDKNKRKEYKNITKDVDPLEKWTKVSELGDGAFGKVFKVN